MRRRDLPSLLLATAVEASVPAKASAQPPCSRPCYPLAVAEGVNPVPPIDLTFPPGNVLRWGADPTGTEDSTLAIQRTVNVAWACGNYGSPWTGKGGATPVVLFPPGRYRVTDSISVPTGVTLRGAAHPANTTSHTRIILDSPRGVDNRDKAIFRFDRATLDRSVLMNTAVTTTIQELEFWFVTPGGTFDRPLAAGIPFGAYPEGAALLFDVDAADTRIVDCVFQHAPAAIRIDGVPQQTTRRADGWPGNRGVGIFVENCEFDASCTHVYATGSALDLTFKECQFFQAMHRYERCTGKVVYQSGRWHGDAYIDAASLPNTLTKFELKGADVEIGPHAFVRVNSARLIDISQNAVLGGASPASCIEVTDADGGCIASNAIDGSGRNAPQAADIDDFTAAVKLRGCRGVLVASNNITGTLAGRYTGFGILSVNSSRPAQHNFINGNAVSAPYDGPTYNTQNRFINITRGDTLGLNYAANPGTATS
jgi:Pectate lyase superfamily protein